MKTRQVICVFSLSLILCSASSSAKSASGNGLKADIEDMNKGMDLDSPSAVQSQVDLTLKNTTAELMELRNVAAELMGNMTEGMMANSTAGVVAGEKDIPKCCSLGRVFGDLMLDEECSVAAIVDNPLIASRSGKKCMKMFNKCCAKARGQKGKKKNIKAFITNRHGRGHERPKAVLTKMTDSVTGKMCCKAGQKIKGNNSKRSVDYCEIEYKVWSSGVEQFIPDYCPDKFVKCCMRKQVQGVKSAARSNTKHWKTTPKNKKTPPKNKKAGKKWRNIKLDKTMRDETIQFEEEMPELPDETGQIVEIHENETNYRVSFADIDSHSGDGEGLCCTAGKNWELITGEIQCEDGLLALPEHSLISDRECIDQFLECCMTPKKRQQEGESDPNPRKKFPGKLKKPKNNPPQPPQVGKEPVSESPKSAENVNKMPKDVTYPGKGRKFPDGKLPDGLRRSPNGHYYYVDFISPELEDKRMRMIKRKQ